MIISRKLMFALVVTTFLLTFLVFEMPRGEYAVDTEETVGNEVIAESVTKDNIRPNVETTFNSEINVPIISSKAYVDPKSSVIGNVEIKEKVFVGPFASIRGDEGQGLYIGAGSNVQDSVVIHALETEKDGKPIAQHLVEVKGEKWAVYIGSNVSLAHQAQVHGPALIEDDVFVGMQALVFNAKIGKGCVIEPGAKAIGVTIPSGTYIPAGQVISTQEAADKLPKITNDYEYKGLNKAVTHVNQELTEGYLKESR